MRQACNCDMTCFRLKNVPNWIVHRVSLCKFNGNFGAWNCNWFQWRNREILFKKSEIWKHLILYLDISLWILLWISVWITMCLPLCNCAFVYASLSASLPASLLRASQFKINILTIAAYNIIYYIQINSHFQKFVILIQFSPN